MKRLKRRFYNACRFYVKHGIKFFSKMMFIVCPFLSLLSYIAYESVGISVAVSIAFIIIGYILEAMCFVLNEGKDFPVPYRRFTIEDEYDGISVKKDDINDMISYVCDVENFLEREGLM